MTSRSAVRGGGCLLAAAKCGSGWQNALALTARQGRAAAERNDVPLVQTVAGCLHYRGGGPSCGRSVSMWFSTPKTTATQLCTCGQVTTGAFTLSGNHCAAKQPKRGRSKNVFEDALCRLHTKKSSFIVVFEVRLRRALPRATCVRCLFSGLLSLPGDSGTRAVSCRGGKRKHK